ncbi:MAG: hypothetical protein V1928_02995 [Parcubacteria group bacterium]
MKTFVERLRQNQSKILALLKKRSVAKNKIERQVLWTKVERLFKEQDRLIERQVDEEVKIKKAKQQRIALKIQAVEKQLNVLYAEVKALDPVKDAAKRKFLLAKIDRVENSEAKLMERHFEAGRLLKPGDVAKVKASSEKLLKELQAIKKRKGGIR